MRVAYAGLLAAALFIPLTAQEAPPKPPNLLRIVREQIKEGHEAAHEAVETKQIEAGRKANLPWFILGMEAVTGPTEVWFVQPFDSHADIRKAFEEMDKRPALEAELEPLDRQDGEQRVSSRTVIARYHPEMSYRADEFVRTLPKMRFVHIIIIRVKPAYDGAVREVAHIGITALEKAGDERPLMTYQVISGDVNTYLLVRATATWAELDKEPEQTQALFAAMGGDVKRYVELVREAVSEEETMSFSLSPAMSLVPKEFAAVDPKFWTPKPKAAPKKPAGEKSEKPPASK